TRGATGSSLLLLMSAENFNPRSHEGSDPEFTEGTIPAEISIHAPTRGATAAKRAVMAEIKISIHAPTRGATQLHANIIQKIIISIHAPTRGATGAEHGDC